VSDKTRIIEVHKLLRGFQFAAEKVITIELQKLWLQNERRAYYIWLGYNAEYDVLVFGRYEKVMPIDL
jgi:hypothetical protein